MDFPDKGKVEIIDFWEVKEILFNVGSLLSIYEICMRFQEPREMIL